MEPGTLPYLSPASLIRSAKAAHPAFKYAIVVAGLAAIVTVVLRFGPSPATLVFGSIIIVVLMALFLVFAQAVAVAKAKLALPALVLVWSFLVLVIATAVFLFTSAFFDMPLPLKTAIMPSASNPPESFKRPVTATPIQPDVPKSFSLPPEQSFPTLHGMKVKVIYSKLISDAMEVSSQILKDAGAFVDPEPWLAEQIPVTSVIQYANHRKHQAEVIRDRLRHALGEFDLQILPVVGAYDIEVYLGHITAR